MLHRGKMGGKSYRRGKAPSSPRRSARSSVRSEGGGASVRKEETARGFLVAWPEALSYLLGGEGREKGEEKTDGAITFKSGGFLRHLFRGGEAR